MSQVISTPVLVAIGGILVLSVCTLFLNDPFHLNKYPGPFLARLSRLWLSRQAGRGNRYEVVHRMHGDYGKFVRIAPDHVSIASHEAIPVVYGHGTGFLKADFYDSFVSIRRGLFNTRDRKEHTRKRKIVSHVFSQQNVISFETHIHAVIHELFGKWDKICAQDENPFDILDWFNYFAFDVIGSLAFGKPFGMVQAERDTAPVKKEGAANASESTIEHLPAIQILNRRGEYSATMGCIPPILRPYAGRLPWFKMGLESVGRLAGIAIAAVQTRLNEGEDEEREDLLSKLRNGKDENGEPMGIEELTAEALTQLIAGSDTTSNSSCAIFHFLSNDQRVMAKLREELDPIVSSRLEPSVDFDFEEVKNLPYLKACIDEALRLHSTSAIGLPRIVPQGGATVCGEFFEEGTTLSVPAYTIHRDREVWGDDAEKFRPERWFERDKTLMNASFIPFSFGPRSCVGRNLATMELFLIVSSTAYRYDIAPVHPGERLNTVEGFLRKPTDFMVTMKRRQV